MEPFLQSKTKALFNSLHSKLNTLDYWLEAFAQVLPSRFEVLKKRRIGPSFGDQGPEMDIVVIHRDCPGFLRSGILAPEFVVAAFEYRKKLGMPELSVTLENCRSLSRVIKGRTGTPYKELHNKIYLGVIADSHNWNSPTSKPLETVSSLLQVDNEKSDHPRHMLDSVYISDLSVLDAH